MAESLTLAGGEEESNLYMRMMNLLLYQMSYL